MIGKLVSKRVLGLQAYEVEPVMEGIALDKNEIPWSVEGKVREAIINMAGSMEFNRYPDGGCTVLKAAIAKYTGTDIASIAVGNGSDELLSILLQTFIEPGDTVAVFKPSFSMYKIYARACGAKLWEYELDSSFKLELDGFIAGVQKEKPKVIFLCNPNNPTGGKLDAAEIEQVLKIAPGIVVADEAYFEFSGLTAEDLLPVYPNLIVLRTFSKALGLAALRIGYMLAQPEVISYIDRVRSPFNVNAFAQAAAEVVLENIDEVKARINMIISERDRLTGLLSKLEGIQCFESWSNFLLIRSANAERINKRLEEAGIYVRGFSDALLKDCLRITIGSSLENDKLYESLKEAINYGV